MKTPWDTKATFSPVQLNSMAKLCNSNGTSPKRAETRRLDGIPRSARKENTRMYLRCLCTDNAFIPVL